ncbi:hypothetical protein B7P43_G14101 [Cryptotermes secundus]|uniref:Uncharacterized protein n=1 Tax=Cryptotermes secundus TaxID=105785 RepID=A0A2J7PYK3_9NEOP|nr:hypothetical protein B7P43_G14101 [Cryptotermes secundus]
MDVARELCPEHVISLLGELPWPARSPDLSACDYFLPRTIDDLNIAITKQISVIPENMARGALGKLRARLEECVRNDGQHLSDVLFKSK